MSVLLSAGALPNAPGCQLSPLHIASNQGHAHAVKLLLQHGADVLAPSLDGLTPLDLACSAMKTDVVPLLAGTTAEISMKALQSAFVRSVQAGAVEVAQQLLTVGALVTAQQPSNGLPLLPQDPDGITPPYKSRGGPVFPDPGGLIQLPLACTHGSLAMVEELLASGSDVNCRDRWESTPLHYVCNQSGLDENGDMPLHVAASRDYPPLVEYLLGAGADLEALNAHGDTALLAACEGGSKATLVQTLLTFGASVHCRSVVDGRTPLHIASSFGEAEVVNVLLLAGAEVDAEVDAELDAEVEGSRNMALQFWSVLDGKAEGVTALHLACMHGYYQVVECLLTAGASTVACNHHGATPLMWACRSGEESAAEQIVRALISYGPSLQEADSTGATALHTGATALHLAGNMGATALQMADNTGVTALHIACERDHAHLVNLLLEAGASVDCKSLLQSSPLHAAAPAARAGIIRALLKARADDTAVDFMGASPLDIARQHGNKRVIEVLEQARFMSEIHKNRHQLKDLESLGVVVGDGQDGVAEEGWSDEASAQRGCGLATEEGGELGDGEGRAQARTQRGERVLQDEVDGEGRAQARTQQGERVLQDEVEGEGRAQARTQQGERVLQDEVEGQEMGTGVSEGGVGRQGMGRGARGGGIEGRETGRYERGGGAGREGSMEGEGGVGEGDCCWPDLNSDSDLNSTQIQISTQLRFRSQLNSDSDLNSTQVKISTQVSVETTKDSTTGEDPELDWSEDNVVAEAGIVA
eukprot:gene3807-13877_t